MPKLLETTEKFKERPIEEQMEYWRALASSNNLALDLMQRERNLWMKKASTAQAFANQQKIIVSQLQSSLTQTTMSFNKKNQESNKAIQRLHTENKGLQRLLNAPAKVG